MAIFYYHPFSGCSRRVLALLEIAGISAERKIVELTRGEHRQPAYLAINPNGQVPTWVDEAITLHESHAIMRYLCDKEELTQWYPRDLCARARTEQWLDWINARFMPAVTAVVFNTCFAAKAGMAVDEEAIRQGQARLEGMGPILEEALTRQAYLGGEQPTIADLSLASLSVHLRFAQTSVGAAALADWQARILEIPGFSDILPPPLRD